MFGIRLRNARGQVMIADATYNLVYIGKATRTEWHTEYWSHGIIGVAHQYGYPYTYLGQAVFYVTVPTDAPIYPMFYCSGYCGIMSMVRVAGNQWRIDCYAQSPPELYIFQKVAPTADTGGGHGIAIKNPYSGTIAYCSNFRHLIPKAAETVYTGPSYLQKIKIGSSYVFWYSNQQEYSTPMDLAGISKPILGFHSGNNAANWESAATSYTWFFGIGAKVAGNAVLTKWCTYWQGAAKQTADAGETFSACVVADGAKFD